MPKNAGTSPKERLLSAALAYVRTSEAPDFSLRNLAAAIGTSHRMLVYHFGSRERLLIDIVRSFEAEQCAEMTALLNDDTRPLMPRLQELWRGYCSPGMRPREKLFFEVYGYALQDRNATKGFLHELVDAWLAPLETVAAQIGVDSDQRRASAGLLLAITRGLLLSLLASGNLRDVEATMQHFLANYAPLRDYEERCRMENPAVDVTSARP